MVAEAIDINYKLGYCRAAGPDMLLSSSPGQDNTMAPYDSTYNSDWYGPGGMIFRHQQIQRLQPRPQAYPVVTTWDTDINTDSRCHKVMDLNMVLNSSLAPDVSLAMGGK